MEQLWRASGRRGKSIAPSHPHPGLLLWIGFNYTELPVWKTWLWNTRKFFHWSLGITVADDVWTHWLCTTWNKLWKLALGIRIEILLLSPQRSENKAAVKQRTAGLRYGKAYFSLLSALMFENIILSEDSNNVANKYKKQVEIGLRKKFSLLWEVSWVASPVSWEMWESRLGIKQCHFYLGNRFFSALWEGRPFNVRSSGFILF